MVIVRLLLFALSWAGTAAVSASSFVQCNTTQGIFTLAIYRSFAPIGADHFIDLVNDGFYTDVAFYRTQSGFLTQFGISDKPEYAHWMDASEAILDDPFIGIRFRKYAISLAGGGVNTRTTQAFIALNNLAYLGSQTWERPFGMVIQGQSVIDALYSGYGDWPPYGQGPVQLTLYAEGNSYLQANFPLLDYIYSCAVVSAPTLTPTEPPVPSPSYNPSNDPTEDTTTAT